MAAPQPKADGGLAEALLNFVPFGNIGRKLFTGQANQITPGEVALEAALTLLPVGRIAKGVAGVTKGVSKTAAKGTAPRLVETGSKLRGAARDIRPGTKLPGTQQVLDEPSADRINSAIDAANKGLPKTGRAQLMGVQDARKVRGQELGTLTSAANQPFKTEDVDTIGRYVAEQRDKIVSFDPKKKAHAELNNNYATRVAGAKDLTELEKQRKFFDTEAKRLLKNPDAKGTLSASMAKAYRDAIDRYVSEASPALKAHKGSYRDLSQAQDLLARPSVTNPQFRTPVFGGPIPGVASAMQVGQEGLGKALQGLGGDSLGARITRNAAGQVGRRIVAAPITSAMQPDVSQPSSDLGEATGEIYPNPTPWLPDGTSGPLTQDTRQPIQAGGIPIENLVMAIAADADATGGKNMGQIMSLYEALNKTMDGGKTKPPTGEQQKFANNAISGLQDIQFLRETLESDPTAAFRAAIPGGSLARNLTGTAEFEAARQNLIDTLSKLRSGAAITEREEKRYTMLVQQAFDSPKTAASKLDRLEELFSRFASPNEVQPDLAEALINSQGAF